VQSKTLEGIEFFPDGTRALVAMTSSTTAEGAEIRSVQNASSSYSLSIYSTDDDSPTISYQYLPPSAWF
jgi:hypothetical protein